MQEKNAKWILLVSLALVWGSSFVLIKEGLFGLSAIQAGSFRIIFAAVFLLLIGWKEIPKIPHHKWKYLVLTAIFGTFLPVYLFAFALTEIDGSVSSILNSLTPLNTLLISVIAFGLPFQRRQLFGVIIGFLGSFLFLYFGAKDNPNQNYMFAILVVIASMCYAININFIKKYVSDLNAKTITVGNFVILLFPAVIILLFTDFSTKMHTYNVQYSLFFILILGIVGTAFANILFFKLIQVSSPIFASSVTYLIPIVAFTLGIFIYHEKINIMQIMGASIVLVGVYLSGRKNEN